MSDLGAAEEEKHLLSRFGLLLLHNDLTWFLLMAEADQPV